MAATILRNKEEKDDLNFKILTIITINIDNENIPKVVKHIYFRNVFQKLKL